jgi:lysophospholipase
MIPARDCLDPLGVFADDVRLRAARFAADPAAPALGTCILLNGQTEFIEKYFEVIDELRGRGFAVAALDWRGQGGSQRPFPDAPLKGYVRDFACYDADLEVFMAQIVTPMLRGPERPIAVAHSMGGHNLLRYLSRHPGRIKAAVFSAPMVMFSTRGQPLWLVRAVAGTMCRAGRSGDFVWGVAGRDPLTLAFKDQIVTSDAARFQRTKNILAQHPDLRLAGPTWGWVAAALRSIAALEPESIATPSLLCGAGNDRVVLSDATRRFAEAMPHGHYVAIEGAEHEILMERDEVRARFWRAFDDFIAAQK